MPASIEARAYRRVSCAGAVAATVREISWAGVRGWPRTSETARACNYATPRARLQTKTVEEMSADQAAPRRNADAADKGDLTTSGPAGTTAGGNGHGKN